jgi:hypothetical protein
MRGLSRLEGLAAMLKPAGLVLAVDAVLVAVK